MVDLGLRLPLPARDEAPELLARLALDARDVEEILDAWPSPADSARWEQLATAHEALVERREHDWSWRENDPWFHAYVFLATVDHVLRLHAERGIPEDVTWATLADVGRSARFIRAIEGHSGLGAGWLVLHFRGDIYRLGRLQFERNVVWFGGTPFERGVTPALALHIPGEAGPMSPEACDDSLARAAEFFPRHFPETHYGVGVCMSWLLDPQLREYLPEQSNIVRFQRRFIVNDDIRDGDDDVFRFVFLRSHVALEDVPQRTTLERAIVAHVRAGRHWHNRRGWLELPD